MKTSVGNWLSAIAIIGMAIPVQAAEISASAVTDVALSNSGSFSGAVVNDAGKPVANTPVQVMHQQTVVAQAKTDAVGRVRTHPLAHTQRVIAETREGFGPVFAAVNVRAVAQMQAVWKSHGATINARPATASGLLSKDVPDPPP